MKPLILYGAGNFGIGAYHKFREEGRIPACFCDSDSKYFNDVKRIDENTTAPILSLKEALNQYPDAEFYVTPYTQKIKAQIIKQIVNIGVSESRIINFEKFTKRLSCYQLERQMIVRNFFIAPCCVPELIGSELLEVGIYNTRKSNEELLADFEVMREREILYLNDPGNDKGICINCPNLEIDYFSDKDKNILDIFSFGIGIDCQFKCIYCYSGPVSGKKQLNSNIITAKEWLWHQEREFEFARYLLSRGIINSTTRFTMTTNGEPVLCKLFPEIMMYFKHNPWCVSTNADVYSFELEQVLNNKLSEIYVSVDAGTAETFKLVKGKDSFVTVCENIKQYAKYGRITLKYILMPGVNDGIEDIKGFLELANEVKANVTISRDHRNAGVEAFDRNINKALTAISAFMTMANERKINVLEKPDYAFVYGKYKDDIVHAMGVKGGVI